MGGNDHAHNRQIEIILCVQTFFSLDFSSTEYVKFVIINQPTLTALQKITASVVSRNYWRY